MEALLSPHDVAKLLRVAPVTVYKWAGRGLLPHFKLEKVIRFSEQDIENFVRERKVETSLRSEKKIF